MKTHQLIKLAFLFVIALSACNDKDKIDNSTLEGYYSGTFTVEYSNGTVYSSPVTVSLHDNEYSCSASANKKPAGGSGGYYLDGDKICFLDENLWTANFDWNLIMSGEYSLQLIGKDLEISSLKDGVGLYQYKLHKVLQ